MLTQGIDFTDAEKKFINSFAADMVENKRQARGVNEQIRLKWKASDYSLEQLRRAGVTLEILQTIRQNWESLKSIEKDI